MSPHYVICFSYAPPSGPTHDTRGQQTRQYHPQHQQGGYPGQQAHLGHQQGGYPGQQAHSGYQGQQRDYRRKSIYNFSSKFRCLTLLFTDDAPPPPPTHVQNYGPEGANNQFQFQYSQCTGKKKALCVCVSSI